MALPSKYSAYAAGTVVRAIGVGLSLPVAASVSGVSVSTIYSWRKRFPEFATQLEQARANAVGKAVQVLNDSSDWRAAAFWLERQCPQEFGA
jgi:predicted NBD/HSP70 family sugar kinase